MATEAEKTEPAKTKSRGVSINWPPGDFPLVMPPRAACWKRKAATPPSSLLFVVSDEISFEWTPRATLARLE